MSKVLGVVGALAIVSVIGLTFYKPSATGEYQPATGSPQVADIAPTTAPIKSGTVKVLRGGAKRLKVPVTETEEVQQSSVIESSDHANTVVTVLDTDTGESRTVVREEPLPWLAWDKHGEAGMYAGFSNQGPTIRLEARQGIAQIKAVHIGLIGSIDKPLSGNTRAFVGVGAWARW